MTETSSQFLSDRIKEGLLSDQSFHSFRKEYDFDPTKKRISEGYRQISKNTSSHNTLTDISQVLTNTSKISNSLFNYNEKNNNIFSPDSKKIEPKEQNSTFFSTIANMSIFQKGWEIEQKLDNLTTKERDIFLSKNSHIKLDENSEIFQKNLDKYIIGIQNGKNDFESKDDKKLKEFDNLRLLSKLMHKKEDRDEEFPYIDNIYEIEDNENPSVNEIPSKDEIEILDESKDQRKVPKMKEHNLNNKSLETLYKNEYQDYLFGNQNYPNPDSLDKLGLFQFGVSSFKDVSERYFYRNNSYKLNEKLMKMKTGYDCIGRVSSSIQENRRLPVVFTEKRKPFVYEKKIEFIKLEENSFDLKREKWNEDRRNSLEKLKKFLNN